MEMVMFFIIIVLFILGKFLLSKLQKNVSETEAKFIQIKYYGWIPISLYFAILLIIPHYVSKIVYFILTSIGYWQVATVFKRKINQLSLKIIILTLILLSSTAAFYFIGLNKEYLFALIFGTVFSDISAYSFSKLSKNKHFLPEYINKNKTIEGVIGGFLGAYFILPLFLVVKHNFSVVDILLLATIIGIASNAGDMLNSIIKRQLKIQDWGETFPGHGGIFDRFISFYMSYTVVTIIVVFIQPIH